MRKNLFVFILGLLVSTTWGQTPCVGGMAGGYPCDNIDLMAHMPLSSLGGGNGNDIWGWYSPTTGKEYALLGKSTGTAFIDVTDPVNPVYLGTLPTHTFNSSWRDIKVFNNYAFIGSEASSHGVQIFDLNQLDNVSSPPIVFSSTDHLTIGGNGRSHNLVMNETTGYLYPVGAGGTGGCSGGPQFYNINNPMFYSYEGCFSADGYTHDAIAFIYLGPDTEHVGKEIIIASNEDTQTIIDMTDKSNPDQLSVTGYAGSQYSHQGWVTNDHKYLLFNDELDERNAGVNTRTHIFDISDLDSPIYLSYFQNSTAAIDHNLYIKGNYVYESNYRSGLRVLRMNDLHSGSKMTEVGFFDVYPANDNSSFNGTWSNYPYLPSGNIIVSGIEQGLFIVRPNTLPHFEIVGPDLPVYIHQGDNAVFDLEVKSWYGFSESVSLSASGNPPGTLVNISNSELTISNTGSVPVGNYSILISDTTTSGVKHSISVGLIVTSPCSTIVTSNSNKGPNTLSSAIDCANPDETIILDSSIANSTIDLGTTPLVVDKNLTIEADPVDNITLTSSAAAPTITVDIGASVTLKGFKVTKTTGTEETVLNKGILMLEDMIVQKSGGPESIKNLGGQIAVKGNNLIKQ
jgi:choice-of-anchor B domain-containing protein